MTDDATQRMAKFEDFGYDAIVFDEVDFANANMSAEIKRYSENNPNKIMIATGDTNQLETIDFVSNQLDVSWRSERDVKFLAIFPLPHPYRGTDDFPPQLVAGQF